MCYLDGKGWVYSLFRYVILKDHLRKWKCIYNIVWRIQSVAVVESINQLLNLTGSRHVINVERRSERGQRIMDICIVMFVKEE